MLKRYFIDEVTDTRASPRQAFSLFSQVDGWSDWCSVVRHARLFGGQWRRGASLLFVADLPRLPPAPVVVRVHEYRENECIAWGLDLPMARLIHRFTFIADGDGGCRVHQEEWSEGLLTLLTLPAGRLIHRFDQRFAAEFAAMF
ncbi:SRPBCC family protein [Alloalcanivorax sp. C16-2]|uniref:SRPBCC family protein n=1 Tax=Alloalcanivorax TaxID=3020832 RepID=UPI001931696F|nr:SRPBCC family protein [Alloalcanivorax marinus]MBL7249139.1 SRPBCC family protein [Alloalcanivorax marinus]